MHLSSVQVMCAALLTLALTCTALPGGQREHHITRRSFYDLQCKGVYDQVMFNRLDRVCDDCYNLFRESQLFNLCRADCFTSDYFKGCVEALLLNENLDTYKKYIKHLHGADPKL
ncbi:ion transport peptide-like isoform X2 [Hyposmocoma kahamanoa]|nr:ion transport peptide-like isoform X2 [Hyposmocoma kahamanoa]XP_026320433.1 ion transport peptide-like isoform X2 [Hyposmocoma kahamanoa]XP_026320434.1 ion transport peptide-like isoform X2 [Hyposmocoma kahamanoa]